MPDQDMQIPLLFIVNNPKSYTTRGRNAKAVASHVSARYRGWRKINRRSLILDSTTKAILTSKTSSASTLENMKTIKIEGDDPTYIKNVERLNEHHEEMTKRSEHFSRGFSKKTFQFQREDVENWTIFADLISPQISSLGSHFFDPFTPTNVKFDTEMRSNLHFYFQVLRPFATHLMKPWHWFDNLAQIQNTPVLAYAVAAFTSIFLSGCLKGGPGVVLPPAEERGRISLWPIPPWLRLQTSCLAELNALLCKPFPEMIEECYEAILFLFRISVLLADGESARMHYKALKRIAPAAGKKEVPLLTELALTKVNIVCAFLHNQSIILLRTHESTAVKRVKDMVEIDRKLWISDREWYNHRASLNARMLAWRVEEPAEKLQSETAAALLRMDPTSKLLTDSENTEMQRCYQIAIYFVTYLHGINFNTSAPRVRSSLATLRGKLSQMNLYFISTVCKCTLFNILLAGAMASRGHWERGWFIKHIATQYPRVCYMDDVYAMLVEFIDPFGVVFSVLEEIWEDVLKFRSAMSMQAGHMDLYRGSIVRPVEQNRPITYSPDLSKPTDIVEGKELTVEIGEEFY